MIAKEYVKTSELIEDQKELMEKIGSVDQQSNRIIKSETVHSPEYKECPDEDIVRILSRNTEAKQMLAVKMAALGLSDNNINKILNLDSSNQINKEDE